MTKEYNETYYYKQQGNSVQIPENQFWSALAQNLVNGGHMPFITEHFMTSVNSTTEFIVALALMDLPFESKNHKFEATGG